MTMKEVLLVSPNNRELAPSIAKLCCFRYCQILFLVHRNCTMHQALVQQDCVVPDYDSLQESLTDPWRAGQIIAGVVTAGYCVFRVLSSHYVSRLYARMKLRYGIIRHEHLYANLNSRHPNVIKGPHPSLKAHPPPGPFLARRG